MRTEGDQQEESVEQLQAKTTDDIVSQVNKITKTADKVQRAAEFFLNKSPNKQLSGAEIYHNFSSLYNTPPITENTFRQYLSNLSGISSNPISRVPGRHKYTISDTKSIARELADEVSVSAGEISEPLTPEDKKRVAREEALYEMLVNWVETNNYQADDISSRRKNEKWGNPDVLGVRLLPTLDGHRVELLSIEAKPSPSDWRLFFFEAVSHKRFCDRVYFCYATDEDPSKIDPDFRYYSELFGVGVLLMVFEPEAYKKYWDIGEIDPEAVSVVEKYNAPPNTPPDELKYRFLSNLDLGDIKKICLFGHNSS
ncbi:hypothetical protein KU6B_43730 [Mameliella alba]|uniref:hypothetical protein n=1 Tax=Mameliella alba TaxID=561184 RepID=UPI0013E50414|nr:hypothetical protein [Mameliella alba]BBU58108.1 hypothetical protein KU6B_43730 [Mameliella alba]